MKIKLLFTFLTLITMRSFAQEATDLSKLQLNEDVKILIKDVPDVRSGKLFDREDMVSYGVANKSLVYNGYLPEHVELLSYRGTVAGYAFRISSIGEQNKIEARLKEKYKQLSVDQSKWLTVYKYTGLKVVVELRTISKDQFQQGMSGYLDVKRIDFYEAYEKLLNQ